MHGQQCEHMLWLPLKFLLPMTSRAKSRCRVTNILYESVCTLRIGMCDRAITASMCCAKHVTGREHEWHVSGLLSTA
jgi:hypothetical protein